MAELTKLQEEVFKAAKKELKKEPWYRGVCMDDFPTDNQISKDFKGAVAAVVANTAYWDYPAIFN